MKPPGSLLEPFRREIERCVKCGSCGAVCPPFLRERSESRSPRGRLALVKAVLDGKLAVSGIFKDRLATCTACFACEAACPCNVPVAAVIQAAKEQALAEMGPDFLGTVVAGVLAHPSAFRATAWLAPVVMRYSSAQYGAQGTGFVRMRTGSRGVVRPGARKGRVAFFPGCAVSAFQEDVGRAVLSVLGRLGYEAIVPDGLVCCGRPLLSLGDRMGALKLAERNARILGSLDADCIVTACASCGLTFKKEHPTLLRPGRKAPVVLDIHEFLAGALGGTKLPPVHKNVTVHVPCHLGRGQGLPRAIHDILRAIPGIAVHEAENADQCCGFGGVMRITHPKLSGGIADEKVRSLIATGAPLVVTGCPGCSMQIADALRRAGSDAAVIHTIQLLAKALASSEWELRGSKEKCLVAE